MLYNLSLSQLNTFLSYVWGRELNFEKENIWVQIAKLESDRGIFSPDWQYCESSLTFSPKTGWKWFYRTTRLTLIKVEQETFCYEVQDLKISVEIPDSRSNGFHSCLIKLALADLPFVESWIRQEDVEPIAIAVNNVLYNNTAKERETIRAEREAERELKAEREAELKAEQEKYEDYEDYEDVED